MTMPISKDAFKNILFAAGSAVSKMDEDTQLALAMLWNLHAEAKNDIVLIENLANYQDYILWQGENDVRFIAESGRYDSLNAMTEEEQSRIFSDVANHVDWSNVSAVGIEAGNNLIADELDTILEKYQRKHNKEKKQ